MAPKKAAEAKAKSAPAPKAKAPEKAMKNEPFTLWGFPQTWGYPNSWMVYDGQSHLEMDDWGYPYDSGNLHIVDYPIASHQSGYVR